MQCKNIWCQDNVRSIAIFTDKIYLINEHQEKLDTRFFNKKKPYKNIRLQMPKS